MALGGQGIVRKDKVVQSPNQNRTAFDGESREMHFVASGEIGVCATDTNGFMNVVFAHHPGLRYSYTERNFPGGDGPLNLAYALPVHQSQGSEFGIVFVVIPRNIDSLSRELIHTAITRSREQVVLLIEGDNTSMLQDLTHGEQSETTRRNTNIFRAIVRSTASAVHISPPVQHPDHVPVDDTNA